MSIVAREPCFSCAELIESERRHADVVKDAVKKAAVQMVADAHRTAIDLVLAHLKSAKESWRDLSASEVVRVAIGNITAMRDWTPEHAAEVLREAKHG